MVRNSLGANTNGSWEDDQSFNPVCTVELRKQRLGSEASERLYAERRTQNSVDGAASYIIDLMERYNQRCMLLQDVADVIET